MSTHLFEESVLSKPYFDREGLIVAVEDGKPIGFVHAGFGPNEEETTLETDWGVTCLIMTRPGTCESEIRTDLLRCSEQYLRSRGAMVLYGGCIRPLTPFYLGLYGGAEQAGVLDTDDAIQQLYLSNDYREIDRTFVLQCDLNSFRPVVNRDQMAIRRRSKMETLLAPPVTTWWHACVWGQFERTEFRLLDRRTSEVLASALFRSMEPWANCSGMQALGLIGVEVKPEHQKKGLATFVLSESFKSLRQQGVAMIEAATMIQNQAALKLYQKLGFQRVGSGAVYRKE